jgi:hypothetical protein
MGPGGRKRSARDSNPQALSGARFRGECNTILPALQTASRGRGGSRETHALRCLVGRCGVGTAAACAAVTIGAPGWSCGRDPRCAWVPRDPRSSRRVPSQRVSAGTLTAPRLDLRFSSGRCQTAAACAAVTIGAPGFEPGTSATRTQRSTGLSHAPELSGIQRTGRD